MQRILNRGATNVARHMGSKEFLGRDPNTVWYDGGELDRELKKFEADLIASIDALKKSLNRYGGRQALDAVAEYVQHGEFSIVMLNHEPHVAFRAYDGTSSGVMAVASLELLLGSAKDEAEQEHDQELAAALRRVAAILGPQVGIPMDEPMMAPEPVRRGRVMARPQ